MPKTRKWIQKAVKPSEKGKFTAWCKSHGFDGPTSECIAAARKMGMEKDDKHLIGMAMFAKRAKKGF